MYNFIYTVFFSKKLLFKPIKLLPFLKDSLCFIVSSMPMNELDECLSLKSIYPQNLSVQFLQKFLWATRSTSSMSYKGKSKSTYECIQKVDSVFELERYIDL